MRVACRGLSRLFGATRALDGVDFKAEPGALTAVIGANGAGKSTLIRILATILKPDAGSYALGKLDALTKPIRARALIGYIGHESMLDPVLTARENLRLFARLYDAPAARVDELIERFQAGAFADSPVGSLSRGQEQAVGLCRALLHAPPLLLLDEPSTGLDHDARERMWTAAREHAAAGATVVFTTHETDAPERLAARVVELAKGKVVGQDSSARLG